MIEPTKSDPPSDQPRATGVRGPVFLLSFIVIIAVIVLVLQLFSPRHDQWWLLGTIGWSALLAFWTYRLVVECRRPAGDDRYMRETTRWIGIAGLVTFSAAAAWFALHHLYGFSIKP
jgi:hypothetical protein